MSMLLDTGATDSFFREFFRSVLTKKKKSSAQIMIADANTLAATESGCLPAYVMNTGEYDDASVLGFGTAVEIPGFIVPGMQQVQICIEKSLLLEDQTVVKQTFVDLGRIKPHPPQGSLD